MIDQPQITEELWIKRSPTDPYLVYPQFRRYLTGGQLKVVEYLLECGGEYGRAFPSNERIAWHTDLEQGSVRNIKSDLVKIGVLSRRDVKNGLKITHIYTVDTTWQREKYRIELGERYPPKNAQNNKANVIKDEIDHLKQALLKASPNEMLAILDRIKNLTLEMQSATPIAQDVAPIGAPAQSATPIDKAAPLQEPKAEATAIKPPCPAATQSEKSPIDEAFVDFIVDQNPSVQNKPAYKAKIKKLLANNELDGIEEYRHAFAVEKTNRALKKYLTGAKTEIGGVTRSFDGEIEFSEKEGVYVAYFAGLGIAVSSETLEKALKDTS
ncbi:MAG: hypothetical protein LBQ52_10785 [Helicobacteraceae bacterium]|jgi:hypothetical protein|nr:hypothetical protein [Helicobacteraceae bacterium]